MACRSYRGALPVVDAGTVVGILTETDILRAFATLATPALART